MNLSLSQLSVILEEESQGTFTSLMDLSSHLLGGNKMTTFITVLVVLAFVAILFGFFLLQKRHTKFSTRVFLALGVGIIFGGLLQLFFGTDSEITTNAMSWIGIAGSGYVRLLQMLVIPLVFVSIVGAFTKMQASKKSAKLVLLS